MIGCKSFGLKLFEDFSSFYILKIWFWSFIICFCLVLLNLKGLVSLLLEINGFKNDGVVLYELISVLMVMVFVMWIVFFMINVRNFFLLGFSSSFSMGCSVFLVVNFLFWRFWMSSFLSLFYL